MQGKTVKLISGGDIIKMLAEQEKIEALQKKRIEEKAVSMKAGAVKPAEGVVGGAVEIAPVPGVISDAVGGRGFANGTSSPLMMPPRKFPVASSTVVFRQNSMISKKLCEITQFPEFAMKSHLSVGFRQRDEKVSAPDLMVVSGKYNLVSEAHGAILKMIEIKDPMLNDLDSLEIDDKLLIMAGKSVILMSFPDAIKFLHRIGVRTSDAVQDVIMAQTEVVVASEAAQDIIMAQAEVSAASEAVQDVIMAQTEVAVASEAAQDIIMAQVAMPAASEAACPVTVKTRIGKVQASVLKTLSGLENLDDCLLQGMNFRQIEKGEVDANGNDISGLINYADVLAVLIFPDPRAALRHVRNIKLVHVGIAPSLTEIDSGNTQVGLLILTYFLYYGFYDTILTR